VRATLLPPPFYLVVVAFVYNLSFVLHLALATLKHALICAVSCN
jgi:hypothetical protein